MRLAPSVLVAASLLLALLVHVPAQAAAGAVPRDLDVLVLAGQSNALGYESYVVDARTHADVFTDATRSPADHLTLLTWDETGVPSAGRDPVALDTPQLRQGAASPIFGPEVGLARTLFADGHRHLLIVKVAMSGSSLARDWLPGDDDYLGTAPQVATAMRWARGHGWTPSVGALYWVQGETDAMHATWAADYAANLHTFLPAVRRALGLGSHEPVVVAQTDLTDFIRYERDHKLCAMPGCGAQWAWNADVMRAQAAAAGPWTFLARTSLLPRAERFIHLTDAGELALGTRFGALTSARLP